MSRIQSLQSGYGVAPRFQSPKKSIAFNGGGLSKEGQNLVDRELIKYLGPVKGWCLDKLSATAGEIQNLIVMNVGTACIAPIFIVNNPLSKENKQNKKYTAWRQPISAIIALGMSLGINMPVPHYVEKYMISGKIKALDLSAMPPKDTVYRMYKQIKSAAKKGDFSKLKPEAKKYFDLADPKGKIKTKEDFATAFATKNEFLSAVHDSTLAQAAEKLLDTNNPDGLHKISFKDYIVKHLRFEKDYANKDILNPEATKEQLEKLPAIDFVNAFGFKTNEKALKKFVKSQINSESSNLSQSDRKLISRMIEVEQGKTEAHMSTKLLLKALGGDICHNFGTDKKFLNQSTYDFLIWLNKNLNLEKIEKGADAQKVVNEESILQMAKGVAKFTAEKISKNYGAYKKSQGIALSLITLPFSCGVLNWAYPRVMERCFPKLANAKADSAKNNNMKGGKA